MMSAAMGTRPAIREDKFALDPVLDFLRLLWSIEHGLQRMSKRMEGELGITGPQRLVLRMVGRFPDVSAGDLAHIVRLHPSTITGILHRLVRTGLLERKRDPATAGARGSGSHRGPLSYHAGLAGNGRKGGDARARQDRGLECSGGAKGAGRDREALNASHDALNDRAIRPSLDHVDSVGVARRRSARSMSVAVMTPSTRPASVRLTTGSTHHSPKTLRDDIDRMIGVCVQKPSGQGRQADRRPSRLVQLVELHPRDEPTSRSRVPTR